MLLMIVSTLNDWKMLKVNRVTKKFFKQRVSQQTALSTSICNLIIRIFESD